ncbi:MAG: NAD synthetase [[Candidatus Thermochlorobacteriaceae] bacterium GBChlB]|nr:MAG: NAD synthetase [[Candidatus Thermochlorobacteriaceae] bacterium GBChlB]
MQKAGYAIVEQILLNFLRTEVRKVGFEKVVLGLSGGVDSAVSCALAVRALGKDKVLAVMMPYKTSSADSLSDAQLLIEQLGISSELVEITPMVDAYFDSRPDAGQLRRGNVMSRSRMITLYDISARDRRLVIGTSNKTELLLGYGTLFGDMASAVNPIGDLYKTQVWELAEYLNIPESIVKKKPSADLWEGQSDEAELGFTYAAVDALLYKLVDMRLSDEEVLSNGDVSPEFLHKVKTLIVRNQFKRMPPVIAKLSPRTLGIDFRYARDWQAIA